MLQVDREEEVSTTETEAEQAAQVGSSPSESPQQKQAAEQVTDYASTETETINKEGDICSTASKRTSPSFHYVTSHAQSSTSSTSRTMTSYYSSCSSGDNHSHNSGNSSSSSVVKKERFREVDITSLTTQFQSQLSIQTPSTHTTHTTHTTNTTNSLNRANSTTISSTNTPPSRFHRRSQDTATWQQFTKPQLQSIYHKLCPHGNMSNTRWNKTLKEDVIVELRFRCLELYEKLLEIEDMDWPPLEAKYARQYPASCEYLQHLDELFVDALRRLSVGHAEVTMKQQEWSRDMIYLRNQLSVSKFTHKRSLVESFRHGRDVYSQVSVEELSDPHIDHIVEKQLVAYAILSTPGLRRRAGYDPTFIQPLRDLLNRVDNLNVTSDWINVTKGLVIKEFIRLDREGTDPEEDNATEPEEPEGQLASSRLLRLLQFDVNGSRRNIAIFAPQILAHIKQTLRTIIELLLAQAKFMAAPYPDWYQQLVNRLQELLRKM